MARKKKIMEVDVTLENYNPVNEEVNVKMEQQVKEEPKNVPLTHKALSAVKNDNGSYSIVCINFNPKENAISPVIEYVETNTDIYVIQERLSVLLHDIESLMVGDYE